MNWIQSVIEASNEAETPISFLYWSALAAISATVSNHVYMNRKGIYQLRPNLYVMLMAKSGLGKGFPENVAKKLVRSVKCTRIISGRNSIQSVVRDLATQSTDEKNPVPTFKDSRGFFVSSEFATSMIKDEAALTILTDLYDCHWNEEWNTKLISRATDAIVKPNLTILSGSSPSHFFDTIPEVNIFGGFVGRLLIIYEEKRSKVNPLLSDVEGETIADINFPYETLSAYLKTIYAAVMNKEGKFKWSHDAGEIWKAWYSPFRTSDQTDKTGFRERMPDHVLKVAMCLSLSECTDLVIRSSHIEEAVEVTSSLGYSTKRVSEGRGKDPLAPQAKVILDHLLTAKDYTLTRQKLLQKGYGDYDSVVLDRIIDGIFMENDWVTKEKKQINRGGKFVWEWFYTLNQSAVEMYQQFKERGVE
jgi:hypothetical protein